MSRDIRDMQRKDLQCRNEHRKTKVRNVIHTTHTVSFESRTKTNKIN